MKGIVQVRTNTNLSVNYTTNKVVPQIELIILHSEPKYDINKKSQIVKGAGIAESRFNLDPEDLNKFIAELQLTAAALTKFSQLAEQINVVQKSSE